MSDDGNELAPVDLDQFIRGRVDRSDLDPEEHPQKFREMIDGTMVQYFVEVESDDIHQQEYHFFTIVRIDDLLGEANQQYHDEVEMITAELTNNTALSEAEARETAEPYGRFTIGNTLTLAYSMAYELVEDLLEELLTDILREDLRDDTGPALVNQMRSFDSKLQVLQASGIIDGSTATELRRIRSIRGDLVHDIEERYSLETFEDLTTIDRTHETLYDLYEVIYERSVDEYLEGAVE